MIKAGKYVIVRARGAGVFAGVLAAQDGNTVKLQDARRLWYWAGAASLSELATRGSSKPRECKFPSPVSEIVIFDVIEILSVSTEAEKSIRETPVWTE
jgi:hypothetical protein